jgi:hypothetical protein
LATVRVTILAAALILTKVYYFVWCTPDQIVTFGACGHVLGRNCSDGPSAIPYVRDQDGSPTNVSFVTDIAATENMTAIAAGEWMFMRPLPVITSTCT